MKNRETEMVVKRKSFKIRILLISGKTGRGSYKLKNISLGHLITLTEGKIQT